MRESNRAVSSLSVSTRRKMIGAAGLALGGWACATTLFAQAPQESMKEAPSTPANAARTSLHQEVVLKASAQRVYEALLDSKQFAAFSGMPADIDAKGGGAFSMFGGMIVGRNVELTPNLRVVQAWRPTHWDPSVYSIVRFDLNVQSDGTLAILDHKGFPAGEYDSLYAGWNSHYFDQLKKYLV